MNGAPWCAVVIDVFRSSRACATREDRNQAAATASVIAFAMLLWAVGPWTPQALAQGLCPRFGGSLEKIGLVPALQRIQQVIPSRYADAKLSEIRLDRQSVCAAEFYSVSRRQRVIVTMEASLQWSTAEPETSQRVLPDGFLDLPAAIDAALKQGMRVPLESARLSMEQPRGKPAVAVWTLSPRDDPQGRVLPYFVAAADAGRPLSLSDVTDYARDYNSQWRYIADLFHASTQPAQPTQGPMPVLGEPCVRYSFNGAYPQMGRWSSTYDGWRCLR